MSLGNKTLSIRMQMVFKMYPGKNNIAGKISVCCRICAGQVLNKTALGILDVGAKRAEIK